MIVLSGIEGTSEHQCAALIADALAALWPGLRDAPADEELLRIAANARIAGYRVSDIDIAIACRLRAGRAFLPRRVVKSHEGVRAAGPVSVQSFVAAIEVKDHDPARVRITGDGIEVRYENGGPAKWSSATDQNVQQALALKNYFSDQHADVFVRRAVVMRGFDTTPCSGALPGLFDGAAFLTALCETSPLSPGARPSVRGGAEPAVAKVLSAPVFKELRPSSLDRRRMDRIITRNSDLDRYASLLGDKMIRFRGRGGTGKTVMLLQLAWRAFEEKGARSLVLTYNRALTSDIRRLLALLNVPSDAEEGGVTVRTVMSFVSDWLTALGLEVGRDGWLNGDYVRQCQLALELIQGGALTSTDIDALKQTNPALFSFAHVIADEAQDWPQPELELIKALYPAKSLCLADGIDQLVRGGAATWDAGVPDDQKIVVPLKTCLRMKANLAAFANAVSERAGLNWRVEPSPEAAGGRVMILQGKLSEDIGLVRSVLEDAEAAGNSGIDSLFCVPGATECSGLLAALRTGGFEVWNGTDEAVRRDFPRSPDSLRVVHYASCRGLEGWSVFLDSFDEHWEKTRQFARSHDQKADHAWRQALIPLTRAIDTLVICVGDPTTEAAKVLLGVARTMPDVVEVRSGRLPQTAA